jgi:hypothetical protein
VAIILGFFLWLAFEPGKIGSHIPPALQAAHDIGLAMFSYANDNDQKYPTGKSSTEVFQKLIDGGYITDPSILYTADLHVPGKSAASSNHLKPENVCWDITIPVDAVQSDGALPLVFSTGYRIEYVPNGRATPLPKKGSEFLAVFYVNNSVNGLPDDSSSETNGIVPNVITRTFDAKGVKYVQLTPDGPLP